MDNTQKKIIWNQFGAAIDMLENAILACPDELWSSKSEKSEFWYIAYHTLFWLDFYLTETAEDFVPPAPFSLTELDPTGILPERVYTKQELLKYLDFCCDKCISVIKNLTDQRAHQRFKYGSIDLPILELILYNTRHVQHHAGQLNLILSRNINSAPRWIKQTTKIFNA